MKILYLYDNYPSYRKDFWQHRWNESLQFDTACQNKKRHTFLRATGAVMAQKGLLRSLMPQT